MRVLLRVAGGWFWFLGFCFVLGGGSRLGEAVPCGVWSGECSRGCWSGGVRRALAALSPLTFWVTWVLLELARFPTAKKTRVTLGGGGGGCGGGCDGGGGDGGDGFGDGNVGARDHATLSHAGGGGGDDGGFWGWRLVMIKVETGDRVVFYRVG